MILLATLNARYRHAALNLRWLQANLGELAERSRLLELPLDTPVIEVAARILDHNPRILGWSVSIWNASASQHLLALLRRLAPNLIIILGGPEVSHETAQHPLVPLADYIIRGEGEVAFRQLCQQLLNGSPPTERILAPPLPDLATLALPYTLYSDHDLAHRALYVESSRGCPWRCAFCLSALERKVRRFPLERVLAALEELIQRGGREFRFVDRTFNLHLPTALAILALFRRHARPGLFLHLEAVPDHLPESLKAALCEFPPGLLQLELGVQSLDPEVLVHIDRKQDLERTRANLVWLRRNTHAHLHTDLIVGLPGEGMAGFGCGFDALHALNPHEIQVGILKRLRGAPLNAQADAWGMVFNPEPPYELLRNDLLDFPTLQRLKRFARYWDLIGNSGRFPETVAWLARDGSLFKRFLALSDFIYRTTGQTHAIALPRLFELVKEGVGDGGRDAVAADQRRGPGGDKRVMPRQARHG